MQDDQFPSQFQLLDKLVEGDVTTYLASDSGGSRVLAHFIRRPSEEAEEVLRLLAALPEDRRGMIRMNVEIAGSPVVITDYIEPFTDFRSWLASDVATAEAGDSAAEADDSAAEAGDSAAEAEKAPGEFTQFFVLGQPGGAVDAGEVDANQVDASEAGAVSTRSEEARPGQGEPSRPVETQEPARPPETEIEPPERSMPAPTAHEEPPPPQPPRAAQGPTATGSGTTREFERLFGPQPTPQATPERPDVGEPVVEGPRSVEPDVPAAPPPAPPPPPPERTAPVAEAEGRQIAGPDESAGPPEARTGPTTGEFTRLFGTPGDKPSGSDHLAGRRERRPTPSRPEEDPNSYLSRLGAPSELEASAGGDEAAPIPVPLPEPSPLPAPSGPSQYTQIVSGAADRSVAPAPPKPAKPPPPPAPPSRRWPYVVVLSVVVLLTLALVLYFALRGPGSDAADEEPQSEEVASVVR